MWPVHLKGDLIKPGEPSDKSEFKKWFKRWYWFGCSPRYLKPEWPWLKRPLLVIRKFVGTTRRPLPRTLGCPEILEGFIMYLWVWPCRVLQVISQILKSIFIIKARNKAGMESCLMFCVVRGGQFTLGWSLNKLHCFPVKWTSKHEWLHVNLWALKSI